MCKDCKHYKHYVKTLNKELAILDLSVFDDINAVCYACRSMYNVVNESEAQEFYKRHDIICLCDDYELYECKNASAYF